MDTARELANRQEFDQATRLLEDILRRPPPATFGASELLDSIRAKAAARRRAHSLDAILPSTLAIRASAFTNPS